MMECHRQDCRYFDNGCTDKEQYDRCMSAIADVQGNAEGCEFCENKPTRYGDTEECKKDIQSGVNAKLIYITKSVNNYFLTSGSRNDWFKIKYCPICGRKLV